MTHQILLVLTSNLTYSNKSVMTVFVGILVEFVSQEMAMNAILSSRGENLILLVVLISELSNPWKWGIRYVLVMKQIWSFLFASRDFLLWFIR